MTGAVGSPTQVHSPYQRPEDVEPIEVEGLLVAHVVVRVVHRGASLFDDVPSLDYAKASSSSSH